ncbi:MAG: hypothetical protein JXB25_09190 [Deltaproteobacteria bacterium]|nr:hypothetical protein [Deltaproteobacteria bacterium]
MAIQKTATRLVVSSLVLLLASGGCTVPRPGSKVVAAGDRVTLHYRCYLPNGELAATTLKDSLLDSRTPKSAIYLPKKNDAPVTLVAGDTALSGSPEAPSLEEMDMENLIPVKIAGLLPGIGPDGEVTRQIGAARKPAKPNNDYTLSLNKVRHRPQVMKMTPQAFRARTGKEPEIGAEFILDPLIPGTVAALSEKEVVVHFLSEEGKRAELPFGPAVIHDVPPYWEIRIDPQIGRLVRTGPMVGRVAEVKKRSFVIDYGHPFGGETLSCEIQILNIEEGAKAHGE